MKFLKSLTLFEKFLWLFSSAIIVGSAILYNSNDLTTTCTSLLGVTALIFIAKGHYVGQVLTIIFSVLYGVVSIKEHYYGEAITYLCMTAPTALFTLISWIRHPYKDSDTVEVSSITPAKIAAICISTAIVTTAFYFILKAIGNAMLFVSTLSIATSFAAASLMFFRSPYYAAAYALNDIVLIILWTAASFSSVSNVPMAACFGMFFLNDIYGFYNWQKMKSEQNKKNISEN